MLPYGHKDSIRSAIANSLKAVGKTLILSVFHSSLLFVEAYFCKYKANRTRKPEMKALFAVGALLVLSTIGFALFIKYSFLAVDADLVTDTCIIYNCTNSRIYDCCPANGYRAADCHQCHDSTAVFLLSNRQRVAFFLEQETIALCARKSITCYYNPEQINQTISVEKQGPGLEIMGLVMLSAWLVCLLLVFFYGCVVTFCQGENLHHHENVTYGTMIQTTIHSIMPAKSKHAKVTYVTHDTDSH